MARRRRDRLSEEKKNIIEDIYGFEATKKWTMSLRNWGKVYGELSIMYDGRLF